MAQVTAFEAALRNMDVEQAIESPFSADPIVSPAVILEINGREVSVVFCELAENDKQKLRFQAIGWVEENRRQIEKKIGDEWRDADANLEQMRLNRWDLLMLHAAMRDPDDPKREACSFEWLESRSGSDLIKYLQTKYREFEDGLGFDQVTGEEIIAFVEGLKKNEVLMVELWQRYGPALLTGSLLYMADQLANSPTDAFEDISQNDDSQSS